MDSHMRSQDLWLPRVGDKVVKCLIANTQLAAGLSDLKGQLEGDARRGVKALTKIAVTAVQAGATALQEVNQRRRDNIYTRLNDTFKSLGNVPEEEGEAVICQKN